MDIESLTKKRWLLLPGTLCTPEVFDGFLSQVGIEKDLRYAIPLMYAQTDEYLPMVNELMRPGDVVCGFSLGAIVAAHLADRLDASALLLFGLNPLTDDPVKAPSRKSLAEAVRTEGGSTALRSRLPPILGPEPEYVTKMILSMADSTADLIEVQTLLALNRPGALPALAASRCPIRLFTGSEDTSAPVALAQAATEAALDARLHVVKGLGHYAILEDPKLCYASFKG